MTTQYYELRGQYIWFYDDGLVRTKIKPGVDFTLPDAQESIALMASVCGDVRRPVLVDVGEMRSITRECRRYLAGPETAKHESAAALLVKSPLARTMGNFFMGVNKTLYPTRLFTSEEEAIAWLRTFLV